jgi:geranylgeranyl diphosphate synthase type II
MTMAWHTPVARVEARLDEILSAPIGPDTPLQTLRAALRDAVLGGGKRLRANIALECAYVAGTAANFDRTLPKAMAAACALELIHAYSLVHDDLPAMDDADTRRGNPSSHKKYGEATAILVGDALLTLAFETLADTGSARAIKLIAHAAGEAGMVGGQMIDIAWSRNFDGIDGEALLHMHSLKTGALIRVAAEAGALLGGGSEDRIVSLSTYGAALGRAFQIADDILDATGDPTQTGKSATDAANGKLTATALFGIEGARELANDARDAALSALEPFDARADALRELARFVVEREK